MPYTPPSHRSPATSTQASPDSSRRPSIHHASTSRPSLPRSASYLTKHRRTPSAPESTASEASEPTPNATSDDLKSLALNTSIRASPPPVADGKSMPRGAILSPPESQSSSEDDLPQVRGRRLDNLRELKDAIQQIPLHRSSSPSRPSADDLVLPPRKILELTNGAMHPSFSTGSLDDIAKEIRRVSHARSATEPKVVVPQSAENSLTASDDEESDSEVLKKPSMVRKKSGELVRPALRPPSRRRPSSMPGTPTFSKAVHFDSHLEHVRHFLQVDRPLAVSAGSSPADNYESDSEFPFPNEAQARSPPYEWEIIITNFPADTPFRRAQPVRLEKVWLSNDQKCLIGSVAVANLAFSKSVACRFTLDYWKTTSEVGCEYVAEIQPRVTPEGHDRFQFTIKLSDLANLESKTLFFCIRYNVNGQEFWDNNNGTNFQADFKKKMLPQNGKKGVIGAASRPVNGLPRSTRRTSSSLAPRPKSMPAGSDEFGDTARFNFDQSLHDYLGEASTSLRLKAPRPSAGLASDNLTGRLAPPSGVAFANRYDFGASLSAAMQAAKDSMAKKPEPTPPKPSPRFAAPDDDKSQDKDATPLAAPATITPATKEPTKSATAVPGSSSPNASFSSSSYEELVNKYCFFGSKRGSPQLADGTLRSGRFDGADDVGATVVTNSTESSSGGSPLTMAAHQRQTLNPQGAQHHGIHPHGADPNPYFQHAAALMALGESPAPSPDRQYGFERSASPASNHPRATSTHSQSTVRSSSPASIVGNIPAFTGTSPIELAYAHAQDRFPFGSEAHTATAIKG